jgi:hypothetical protein
VQSVVPPAAHFVEDRERVAVFCPGLVGRRQQHERVEHDPVRADVQVSDPHHRRFLRESSASRRSSDSIEPDRRERGWGFFGLGRGEDRPDFLLKRAPVPPCALPQRRDQRLCLA